MKRIPQIIAFFGLFIGSFAIDAFEPPPAPERKRKISQIEQEIPELPKDLQKKIFEEIIPCSQSIEEAVRSIKNCLLLNQEYYQYFDNELIMNRIVQALAEKWTDESWEKAALYLGTLKVQEMLRRDLEIQEHDEQGNVEPNVTRVALNTIFQDAAKQGDLTLIRALIALNFDVNMRFEDNDTPLILASREGHFAVVNYLLEHGANPNLVIAGIAPLFASLSTCNEAIFNRLLEAGADLYLVIQVGELAGYNALMLAAANGCIAIVDRLLHDPQFNVNTQPNDKRTALMQAAVNGHIPVVLQLLTAGAQVNLTDILGNSALHYAANAGRMLVVNMLIHIAGVDINIRNNRHATPLILALENRQREVARLLIEAGADFQITSTQSENAFLLAAELDYADILQMLIERGADPNNTFATGTAPLWDAAYRGNVEAVRVLLEHGARVSELSNGTTPLFVAIRNQASENVEKIVDLLLEYEADPNQAITIPRAENITPLFAAISSLHPKKNNLIIKLIQAGANLNHIARVPISEEETIFENRTPLMYAVQIGYIPSIELLLNAGADVTLRDNRNRTAYRLAQELSVTPQRFTPEAQEFADRLKNIVELFQRRGIRE